MLTEHERVRVLIETLPYVKEFSGCTVVIKYGGSAMVNKTLKSHVVNDVIFFSLVGIRPVLIHGGGSTINLWLDRLHITPIFKNGVRVTDRNTMQIVEMVLTGKINKELVTMININGGSSVGLCGKDGGLILAKPWDFETMGFVGSIVNICPRILNLLISNGYIPVIASVAYDMVGQSYNINADTLASQIAVSLNAEKLIFLTDMPGILTDVNDSKTLIHSLNIDKAKQLEKDGIISGGMIPKIHSCIHSLEHGVISTHIIDGRQPHALLLSILTDQVIGSTLVHS